MEKEFENHRLSTAREKFLALSLESTRKSYYPQLQKQLEAAEKNEQQLRLIADNLPAWIYYVDAHQRYQFVNCACEKAFGLPRDQIIGRHASEVLGEKNYTKMVERIEKALSGERLRFEEKITGPNGEFRWWEVNLVPDFDAENRVIGFYGLTNDLTDRKRAEEALRKSEDKYRRLVENASEAIFILQDDVIRFPNPKTLAVIGCTAGEIRQVPFIEFVHPEDRQSVASFYKHLQKEPELPQMLLTFRLINCDSEPYTMQLNAVSVTWEDRPAILNFLTDITAQKVLEAHLQRAQKMEAIGKLAGGIAHDFNNLLMGIQGRISLMLNDMEMPRRFIDHLVSMEAYVKSAADLTHRLLGFARGGKYEIRPADLNDIVNQSVDMFGRTKKDIRIRKAFDPYLWPIEVDRRQIEQVLLNLFVNAWQAMPGGGSLYLETRNVVLSSHDVDQFHIQPGRYVEISVADTGIGMDEETLARAFDPFFTTKEVGRGTGLGLASAYGIIENHHGLISIQSEKGKGTIVTVLLPASEKQVSKTVETRRPPAGGAGTVLLVDDEQMILEVGGEMLKTLGYAVFPARGGKAAIDILAARKDEIDMVILDMVMPDMGGAEVFDALKSISPDVRILLSSGYSLEGQAAEILNRGSDGFIQKPFDLNALAEKINFILKDRDQ